MRWGLAPGQVPPMVREPVLGPVRAQVLAKALNWGSVREMERVLVPVWELLLPCLLFLRSLALFCCLAAQPGNVELRKLHHL